MNTDKKFKKLSSLKTAYERLLKTDHPNMKRVMDSACA